MDRTIKKLTLLDLVMIMLIGEQIAIENQKVNNFYYKYENTYCEYKRNGK